MDFPPLGHLRIASPDDVPRISVVATAAFRYSPLFEWERPNHSKYPEDTLESYRAQFLDAIQSDDHIVLVREDAYLHDENNKTAAIIPDNTGWTTPKAGEQVIVGVISIKLDPGSPHVGKLKSNNGCYLATPHSLNRDLNQRHYDEWGLLSATAKRKNRVHRHSTISMIVVHPAYWRRGHGTQLATWARDLSRMDRIPQCVSAAPMSQCLFMSLGFREIDAIVAEGDKDDPRGVKTLLLEFGREYRGEPYQHLILRWIVKVTKDSLLGLVRWTQRTLNRMQVQGNEKWIW
ncbi:hypothetical protein QC761_204540 [Podospora bellae-mahoneyi]|uniref:N-acetyltransferase domain-containing protein n=1 Tax=Podospora bellae-mahoneyi TaxID=2093777 RepID=A0ABR0FS03_9PEZI|nr:hypothetical protein QC761_204540 [Podospora bellae-mahoneyi]